MKNAFFHFLFFTVCLLLTFCRGSRQGSDHPNILFVINDDQSFLHTSFAGCEFVNTPGFDRIATEGVYFKNCYAGSPGCAPSRSSIVTGRYHWQNEQSGQHAAVWLDKYKSFVDILAQNGYKTGVTGKGVGPFYYAEDLDLEEITYNGKTLKLRHGNAAGPMYNDIRYGNRDDERVATGINNKNYFANFKKFMAEERGDKPFFFWYGSHEPHRKYEEGSWRRNQKILEEVTVPEFYPDHEVIRSDLLDYAVEIEWADLHLERMIDYLEEIGELENTIVIVTADNGMPFPRAKANGYEYGTHVPLAIRYPKQIKGNRIVEDLISFVDLAPTIFDLVNVRPDGMLPMSGKSFSNLLYPDRSENPDQHRHFAISSRERHSSSRYLNWGYPQRIMRSDDFLFIWNMKPNRWPSGAPQRFDAQDTSALMPMFGLNAEGKYIPDGAFTDIDDCPTKTFLIENHRTPGIEEYFKITHDKRPEFELFNVVEDPSCVYNLMRDKKYEADAKKLKALLLEQLTIYEDPRVVGKNPEIFDSYKRHSRMRKFPKPDWLN